ncbi:DUF4123 domain-containing protein [Paracoccus sp. M683]|uniref:DUF4123 domain-containing protein n=1 Tax=Paracoccus sp. M683 TaxID=2594268 RepID=UPI00117FF544|nr:DUF4123 domain-containing protein [Paracoccus sp. M683]TRW99417.1 DUF4123 domain-containing protein [Paracoccus sp. M683]
MQQDDPWSLAPRPPQKADQPAATLAQALLALDYRAAPAFAVLDGAQFDNLPQALLIGGYVSRPLYLDRGDNNPEQIITAPHMVWLDERTENVTGRTPQETIPALLNLIAGRPAAVFWQCPAGGDALYRHLRGINMVLYPKSALPDFEEPAPEDGPAADDPGTHTLVLFRHADSNVIAQTLPAMTAAETARFFGPASQLLFAPDPDWAGGRDWIGAMKPAALPNPPPGPLTLSVETVDAMSGIADESLQGVLRAYLKDTDGRMYASYSTEDMDRIVIRSIESGQGIGFKEDFSYLFWSYLMMATGGAIADDPEVLAAISQPRRTPDEQLEHYVDSFLRSRGY